MNAPEIEDDNEYAQFIEWYVETFDANNTPTFDDFVKAHLIAQTDDLEGDEITENEEGMTYDVWESEKTSFAFFTQEDTSNENCQVWCISTFLWDNERWEGKAVASAYTYLMYCPSGAESDVFDMLDCDWADVNESMLPLLQTMPATTCRMFALGLVGLTHLHCTSSTTPAYKTMLNQIIVERILPGIGADPYVMFYGTIPAGYNFSLEDMTADATRLRGADEIKGLMVLEQRFSDQHAHIAWQFAKLKASPVSDIELSMRILDHKVYCEEVLMHMDETQGVYMNSIEEPREEMLTYDEYLSGNYESVGLDAKETEELKDGAQ